MLQQQGANSRNWDVPASGMGAVRQLKKCSLRRRKPAHEECCSSRASIEATRGQRWGGVYCSSGGAAPVVTVQRRTEEVAGLGGPSENGNKSNRCAATAETSCRATGSPAAGRQARDVPRRRQSGGVAGYDRDSQKRSRGARRAQASCQLKAGYWKNSAIDLGKGVERLQFRRLDARVVPPRPRTAKSPRSQSDGLRHASPTARHMWRVRRDVRAIPTSALLPSRP